MITGLEDDVRNLAVEVLTDAADALLDDLREDAPLGTGELRDSAYGPFIDEEKLTATIGFSAPQADWTDVGTEPHLIEATNAPRLVFFWDRGPSGPGVYSFNSVDHPGVTGSGWFSDKVEDASWQDYVDEATERQNRL